MPDYPTLAPDNHRSSQLHGDNSGAMTPFLADSSGNQIVIGSVHNHTHAGRSFTASRDTGSIADAAASDILIQVGSTSMHFMFSVGTTAAFTAYLYEGTTFSAAGTAITAFNKNRSSATVTNSTITHTPTVTLVGTIIQPILVSGGKKSGSGEELGENDQWVLSQNTDYMIRMTNISGGAAQAIINLGWYEPGL